MKNKYKDFVSFVERSNKSMKALTSGQNLAFLNSIVDAKIGKALKSIYDNKNVVKCSSTFLGSSDFRSKNIDQYYGHLIVDNDKYYRVSSCLNKQKMTVQIPISERKYWNDKTFLCFTTGDLFLSVKTSKLDECNSYETQLGNIEYSIPELFFNNAVENFGIISDSFMMSTDKNKIVDLNSIKMSKRFNEFKIKGCLNTFRPKYVLQRLDGTMYSEYYTTLAGIEKVHKNIEFSAQYLNKLAKDNANLLLNDFTYNKDECDDYRQKTRLVNIDGNDYMIVSVKELSLDILNDINKICQERKERLEYSEYIKNDERISDGDAINYFSKKYNIIVKTVDNIKSLFGGKLSFNICDEAMQLGQVITYG